MLKIFALLFVWGPAFLGFALGWVIRHPQDWTGPALIAPVALALTIITYRWGLRKRSGMAGELRMLWTAGMAVGAAIGIMVFGMLVTGLIG